MAEARNRFATGYVARPVDHLRAALMVAFTLGWIPLGGTLLAVLSPAGSVARLVGMAAVALFTVLLVQHEARQWHRPTPPFFPNSSYKGRCKLALMYQLMLEGTNVVLSHAVEVIEAFGWKNFWVTLPSFNIYLVADPASIEHVLDRRFLAYEKGPRFHTMFVDALGDGIFNSDGDAWRQQRRTSAHLFTSWQLENRMADVFQRRAEQLNSILKGVKAGETIDVQQLMYCYTFDVIYEIAFGRAVDSLGGNKKDVAFQRAFDFVQKNTANRFFLPQTWWQGKKILNIGSERENAAALATIKGYVAEVLRERREGVGSDTTDLISLLDEQNEKAAVEGGKVYSDAEIIDFITNFTIAGRDTTASALTWTFYELSKPQHRQVRERVEKEIAAVDDVKEMHYLQAVFQEVLRLWPSVPLDIKVCTEQDTLPSGEVIYPGEALGYSPLLVNMNPNNFPNPERFDPDRWMQPDGTCKKYDPKGFTYPTFNAGPRLCLGRFMAAMEAKTVLSTVMGEYRLDVPAEHIPRPLFTIVMNSRNGMPVRVSRREA